MEYSLFALIVIKMIMTTAIITVIVEILSLNYRDYGLVELLLFKKSVLGHIGYLYMVMN